MNKSLERKQRNEKKRHKRQLVGQLDVLEQTHCKPCDKKMYGSKTSPSKVCGGCAIYSQIRNIGKNLSRQQVTQLKANKQKLTKNTIKSEEIDVPTLTVGSYNDYRAKGLKDKEIAKRLGVSVGTIYQFKSANGLSNKTAASKPKGEENVEVSPKQVVPNLNEVQETVDTYFEKKKTVVLDPEKIEMQYKIEKLERDVQLHKDTASKAMNDLHLYTRDYAKLETDFLNSENENKRIRVMLEKLKDTAQINVWLMKQHVGFVEQADSLVAGEVDNTWR